MYKITLKAKSGDVYPGDYPQDKYQKLIDNAYEETDFSEYFHGSYNFGNGQEENQQSLINKGVNSGYMRFELINDEIWTITEYFSPEKLTNKELEILKNYTQGQWSDGVGEGFEQSPITHWDGKEIFLSPWYREQNINVEQKKINSDEYPTPKKDIINPNPTNDQTDITDLLKKTQELIDKLKKY